MDGRIGLDRAAPEPKAGQKRQKSDATRYSYAYRRAQKMRNFRSFSAAPVIDKIVAIGFQPS